MSLPLPRTSTKKEVKGVDYFTQSFDINMDTWIDLKTIVYNAKKKDPTYTQRKALARAIEVFKETILKAKVPLDVPEEVLEEAKRRGELIKEGKRKRNPSRKTTDDQPSSDKPDYSVLFS
ncbi:MAG: hypothetical protein ABJH04_07795 [Cyclobacteriaceae bacterium]